MHVVCRADVNAGEGGGSMFSSMAFAAAFPFVSLSFSQLFNIFGLLHDQHLFLTRTLPLCFLHPPLGPT